MKKRLFPLLLALMLLITLCTPFAQAAGRVLTVTSAAAVQAKQFPYRSV